MGVVYMAEQEKPVRRRVALKINKPGMDTGRIIARFEAERQALALMDHPNIARVLEAGTTGITDEGGTRKDEQEVAIRSDSSFSPHPSSFPGLPYFGLLPGLAGDADLRLARPLVLDEGRTSHAADDVIGTGVVGDDVLGHDDTNGDTAVDTRFGTMFPINPWRKMRDTPGDEVGSPYTSSASSFHPNGANVAFADGSVKFLKETIDSWAIDDARGFPVWVSVDDNGFLTVSDKNPFGVCQKLSTRNEEDFVSSGSY